jgi:hypothetical protein
VIVAVPEAMPVTTPVPVPTVAILVLLLVHIPPDIEELKVVVAPSHTVVVPLIAPGVAITVTTCVAATEPQPFVTV